MSMPPPIPPAPNVPADAPHGPVPTYMAWSIVATVLSLCLCCVFGTIPGIVAIVFSSKVNGALARGDVAEARRASSNAKIWAWITTAANILGLAYFVWLSTSGQLEVMMEQIRAMQAAQGV